jgi:hypothetical protein
MNTVAINVYRDQSSEPVQFMATVSAVEPEGGWRLRTSDGALVSRVAASCLLTPEPSDQVLAVQRGEDCWILAVLERSRSSAARIETDGDLHLHSRSGTIEIDGQNGIGLVSSGEVGIRSGRFRLATRMANMLSEKLDWVAGEVSANFRRGAFVGGLFSSVLERLHLKARSAGRDVVELDQIRAGNMDYRAEQTMSLRAENVLTKAEELAKVDGGHIHLG